MSLKYILMNNSYLPEAVGDPVNSDVLGITVVKSTGIGLDVAVSLDCTTVVATCSRVFAKLVTSMTVEDGFLNVDTDADVDVDVGLGLGLVDAVEAFPIKGVVHEVNR